MRVFSLRGHKAPVSSITQLENDLVTADRDGHVIIWDLLTKRCKAIWRAHDGHIVTLEKTQWGLLTHGRDSCIRIWKGPFDNLTNDVSVLSQTPAKPGPSTTESLLHPETKSNLPAPDHFEIPVNSLNFCNVAVSGNIIATPATRDSERFDVYQISASHSLLRLVENYGQLLEGTVEGTVEGTRTGTGIIMRLLFVSESLLFAGYESGRVRGYRLKRQNVDSVGEKSRLVMNKDMKVTVVMDEAAHVPQPVLTMEYDARKQVLYTGSASKKLKVYSVRHLVGTGDETGDFGNNETDVSEKSQESTELSISSSPSAYNLGHYGIQSLIVDSQIIAGFWDGNVLIFKQKLEKLAELERQEEFIQPGNDEEPNKTTKKLVCLHLWHPQDSATLTTRKSQLRSRKLSSDPLLFVGHGDGLVSAYSLK